MYTMCNRKNWRFIEMKIKAMAKINLSLDVLRKREDGYHELRMIMQTINLYDELTIEKTEKKGKNVCKITTLLYICRNLI